MTLHDAPPTRPTADWISRYAAGLLSTTHSLKPLDAVRLAMDACIEGTRPLRPPNPPQPARS